MELNLCMGCMREKQRSGPCPYCGFDEATYEYEPHQLPPLTILNGKYLVGKVLGQGGFGITYIGWDLNLEIKVAIKEYYPNGYVTRSTEQNGILTVMPGKRRDFFVNGRDKFIEEAKQLAKFLTLPGIVSVRDYFQENGTAYIVMEFIEGKSLKQILDENNGKINAGKVFQMMRPVISSLNTVHEDGIIHRDISPDNMMVDKKGNVKLIDFGSARSFLHHEQNHSLTVILKPGYAPKEQYYRNGKQGPWTDVYALCATMYRAITGSVLPEVMEREEQLRETTKDIVEKLSQYNTSISANQEKVLLKGLELNCEKRIQSMSELEKKLYETVPTTGRTSDNRETKNGFLRKKSWKIIAATCIAAAWISIGVVTLSHMVDKSETWTSENGTIYTGKKVNAVIDGYGTAKYTDGRVYKGEFVSGKKEGTGTIIWYDSEGKMTHKYEGDWANDQIHGSGIFNWYDSEGKITQKYEGEFAADLRSGTGTYIWYDSEGNVASRYEGEWKNHKRHGHGIMYDSNGNVTYDGEWENDERVSEG